MFVFTLFHLLCGAHCQFLLVLLQSFDYDIYTTHTHNTHTHNTRAYSCQTPTQTGAFIVVSVSSLCNSIAVACLISIELLLSAAHTHRHTCTHSHTHTRMLQRLFDSWFDYIPKVIDIWQLYPSTGSNREGNGKRVTSSEYSVLSSEYTVGEYPTTALLRSLDHARLFGQLFCVLLHTLQRIKPRADSTACFLPLSPCLA